MGTQGDAFGRALADWAAGGTEPEVIERDDGFGEVGAGHELYVTGPERWPAAERRALRLARGRVVDVGCAAGRVALHLQERGMDVVGVDASPLAVRTARARGLRAARCMTVDALGADIGSFDTAVLFGNNFGIFGTPAKLRRALMRWARTMPPGARILAESTNPYCGGVPAFDRSYYRRNVERGLMPGQARLRVRYRRWETPWFAWLFVSRADMRSLLRGTGWHQADVLGGAPSEPYVAVLEKS
ncbi:MAG TPA: class I SAM-dependent methyltransferase [Acidimicrobiales bacterium]|nr:class I SAM-dependent methyltransferase [Acidimicrobiales bacterium]